MHSVPLPVAKLLTSKSAIECDDAWSAFLAEYSRLLLHVTRSVTPEYDESMDAYTHLLGVLRADDFSRLRTFVADGRSKFTTWLVVVARRVCVDHLRSRYGRARPGEAESVRSDRAWRRRLSELAGDNLELSGIPADVTNAEDSLIGRELSESLFHALERLEPADRLIVKLRFEDGLAASAIAPLLGLPTPFHVYRRLEAIAATLKRALAEKGVTSSIG